MYFYSGKTGSTNQILELFSLDITRFNLYIYVANPYMKRSI